MTDTSQKSFIPYIIVIVFVLFGGFIGQFVYRSMKSGTILVSKDYYKNELDYQQKIDKKQNTQRLANGLQLELVNGALEIQFPAGWQKVKGTLFLSNIVDEKEDLALPFTTTDNLLKFKLNDLHAGKWLVKLEFENNEELYFHEQTIVL